MTRIPSLAFSLYCYKTQHSYASTSHCFNTGTAAVCPSVHSLYKRLAPAAELRTAAHPPLDIRLAGRTNARHDGIHSTNHLVTNCPFFHKCTTVYELPTRTRSHVTRWHMPTRTRSHVTRWHMASQAQAPPALQCRMPHACQACAACKGQPPGAHAHPARNEAQRSCYQTIQVHLSPVSVNPLEYQCSHAYSHT
jgi:hypothetical protein